MRVHLSQRNDKPVVLHTLPASLVQTTNETEKTRGALSNATTVIPRLVSVVEIIKREYLKSLELKHSTRLTGLHQYNELGCLEDLEAEDNRMEQDTLQAANEEARVQNIVQALGGKNQYVALVSLRSVNSFRCSSSPLTQCEAETNSVYAHYPFNAISA